LRLLSLDDAIPEDGLIDTQTRVKMESALFRIHSGGYVHGDIERRNFCEKGNVGFLAG
jgi:tRNA A-37 threonylcarbamoyl transferase component Bud32